MAHRGFYSYLHNKWQKAMHHTFIAMEKKVDLQGNKIVHLENSVVMYGIYNSETLEKLIKLYIKCIILLPGMKNYLLEIY